MSLPGLLLRLFATDKPELLGEKISSRSRAAVWNRVSHRIHTLTGAEARGYIRARAATVIEQETELLIAEVGAKAARHRDQILRDAHESVTRLILEQANSSRRSALPMRRAA
ncbi:MAG: hypothetical protein ACKVP0_10825 [Pirellulaceae bacterium]